MNKSEELISKNLEIEKLISNLLDLEKEFYAKGFGHKEFFAILVVGLKDEDTELKSKFFLPWARKTENSYALAWLLGKQDTEAEIVKKNVKRAANGRRLIGATSRAKVAKTAESFRHLSKERAAAGMAEIVNLDPGTIRRYLSELFPGDKWRK